MNKEDLEKMFDNKFTNYSEVDLICVFQDMKEFIFNEMIPEILKELTLSNETCLCCQNNKQKAKDLYNITL